MKRLKIAIITGGLLGILCIIGVGIRLGFQGNELFIIATYFNRLLMGLVIGLAGGLIISKTKNNVFFRGLILGLIVSFSLYLSTEFKDLPGFLAGIVYGFIIDFFATKYGEK